MYFFTFLKVRKKIKNFTLSIILLPKIGMKKGKKCPTYKSAWIGGKMLQKGKKIDIFVWHFLKEMM
jgi:hypothetical protein